jgi:hypothetical protein
MAPIRRGSNASDAGVRSSLAASGSGGGADRMPIAGFQAPSHPSGPDRPPQGNRHHKIQFTGRFP